MSPVTKKQEGKRGELSTIVGVAWEKVGTLGITTGAYIEGQ